MIPESINKRSGPGVLLMMAAFVIVVAGMKAAEAVLVPFLLAAFLALICGPPMFWLERKRVPSWAALLIVIVVILGIGSGLGALIGKSLNAFTAALPSYQERLEEQTQAVLSWADSWGIAVPDKALDGIVDPGQVMQLVGRALSGLGGVLTNGFLIALTVLFILLEASSFPAKLRAAFGDSNQAFARFDSDRRQRQSIPGDQDGRQPDDGGGGNGLGGDRGA